MQRDLDTKGRDECRNMDARLAQALHCPRKHSQMPPRAGEYHLVLTTPRALHPALAPPARPVTPDLF
ncbi:hypothetical protein, partial [uncultured Lentibacter sp.]|uniref:hypothetical protein n=1 Tax=uncultured Lentibacter sp. TaxID=1659309 RepID=UPI0026078D55